MVWKKILSRFADQPLFHSSMLGIFPESAGQIKVQLSRWVKTGRLEQIRRGWYLIKKPYRGASISSAEIATAVLEPSYLSFQWALAFHDIIPESVPNPTLATTRRGQTLRALGRILIYHHIHPRYFAGYVRENHNEESLVVATPEKALWDLIYLHTRSRPFTMEWLNELRLQNLDRCNLRRFSSFSQRLRKMGDKHIFDRVLAWIIHESR